MIDAVQFDDQLRQLVRPDPFRPFVVELDDGRLITIAEKPVVFCDGAATHVTADNEMVEFFCDQVRQFRPIKQEAAHER